MNNSSTNPPKWASRFLQLICPDHLLEEIEGDLIQKFNKDLKIAGEKKAKRRFVWNAIGFFRPGILLRNSLPAHVNQLQMFKNYFKTTYRHILNSKLNFAFKLGGLTITVLSFLIVAIYISSQHSFDRYHNDFENIYRVNSERKENGKQERYAIVPMALGPMMQGRFPEVAAFTRYRGSNQRFIRYNQKVFSCDIPQVDSSFFNVFTVRFLAGSKDALKKPKSIALTRSLAAKIFGDADPLNQLVTLTNGNQLFQVTAVIEDFPGNSHLTAEALISIENTKENFSAGNIISPVDFVDQSTVLYTRFRNPINPDLFSIKLESMVDNCISKKIRVEIGFHISLQSLADIYLSPSLKYEFTRKGSVFYIYAFSVLGVFLLIIGSVNYINLSIADFNSRWREIGIRKVMGARRIQIVLQVVIETFLYVAVSLILGVFFLYTIFPKVMELVDTNLRFDMLFSTEVVITVGAAMFILIILATLIPYFQLSGPSISMNLTGAQSGGYKSSLGKTLLAVQFIISVFCISATIIVGRQLSFIHNKDLGFDRKDLIVILVPDDFSVRKMQSLKNEIKRIPGVEAVSNSSFKIGGSYWKDWYTTEVDGQMKSIELYEVFSDDELFSTLRMKLVDGRLFNANNPADSGAAFVINETAVDVLGWKDPVGKRILTHPEEPGKWEGTVVGVVKDINISPLYEKVQPLVMRLPWQKDYPEYFVYVRLNGPVNKTLKAIERKYSELLPGFPFEYDDVDTFFNSRYQRENKAFGSLIFATIIILTVSSIGIFSLSIYLSTKRMKEFGIRKVLGASVSQIMALHVWHFISVAFLSNMISIPITYWLMKEWLNGFAYRTELSVFIFLIVMGISFLLVIISGGYSAWKAGRMNPVDVIKIQ